MIEYYIPDHVKGYSVSGSSDGPIVYGGSMIEEADGDRLLSFGSPVSSKVGKKPSVQEADEKLPEHFNKEEWETRIYELMKEEWIQEILYPITPECNGGSDTCFSPYESYNRPIMIPFDKIIKVSTVIEEDTIMEPTTEYYVEDNDKNKIKLDISKGILEKSIYIGDHISYNRNPFYFVECIAQWERYPLRKLSPKCFRVPQGGGRQDHTHTLDIIHDVIYPRYLHYKTISHRN